MKTHRLAHVPEFVGSDKRSAVVVVEEHAVATIAIEKGVVDSAVLGAVQQHGAPLMQGVIPSARHGIRFEEGRGDMLEDHTTNAEVPDWGVLRTLDTEDGRHSWSIERLTGSWHTLSLTGLKTHVKIATFHIVKPLTRLNAEDNSKAQIVSPSYSLYAVGGGGGRQCRWWHEPG